MEQLFSQISIVYCKQIECRFGLCICHQYDVVVFFFVVVVVVIIIGVVDAAVAAALFILS